jgi:glycosyltransferase involved in cell wall biosynthesis
MKLTIIIPVFNEEKTISAILKRVAMVTFPHVSKEVIIINDASTDKTDSLTRSFLKKHKNFRYFSHEKNQGKGSAVRTGITKATGDYIIIQDADLEYDPKDIGILLHEVQYNHAEVVYGTRLKRKPDFTRDERTTRFFLHYIGNRGLSLITSLLYGQFLTDMETCYKLIPRNVIKNMPIHARGFEIEPELTAKLLKKGLKITEVPISTNPRGYEEGKKLNTIRDGYKALVTLITYRFRD